MKKISPDYLKNFKCDGKACGSNCCLNWKVEVDSATYEKYFRVAEIFAKLTRDGNRPVMKMLPSGRCPFLGDDSLCRIQKEHGEEFLTAICQSYPRITYFLPGDVCEQSLTLTCPVAAELILLRESSISFDVTEEEISQRHFFDFTDIPMTGEEIFSEQSRATEILQDKNFSIPARLKNLLETFSGRGLPEYSFDLPGHSAAVVEIFDTVYNANFDAARKDQVAKLYAAKRRDVLPDLYERYAQIFENYLVNEFFMRCYPHVLNDDSFFNIKTFLTAYGLLEFAVVISALSAPLETPGAVAKVLSAVNDRIDHGRGGMKAIAEFAAGFSDPATFAALMLEQA